MRHFRLFFLLAAALLVGCSAAATDGAQAPRRNTGVLTQEEMRAAHYTSVYDAVASLRSNWIRQQAPSSFSDGAAGQVHVFMEGMLLGDVSTLRQFHVNGVRSIQYLNPSEAASRFGLQSKSGPAIVIVPYSGG